MASENEFEDALAKHPDLIESGLQIVGRQVTVYGRRMDLVFRDHHGRTLITELKWGPIKDEHIGQIMSYEGCLLSSTGPDVRVMLIGTRVPPNLRATLDHHGIAWKEITPQDLVLRLLEKGDTESARLFQTAAAPPLTQPRGGTRKTRQVPVDRVSPSTPSDRAEIGQPRVLSEVTDSCKNPTVVDLVGRALKRGQKTTGGGLKFEDSNGQVRWYMNIQDDYAKVIQKGRFDGDERFWKAGLSDPGSVKPKRITDGGADLRFYLWTAVDCDFFEDVAASESQSMRLPWELNRRKATDQRR